MATVYCRIYGVGGRKINYIIRKATACDIRPAIELIQNRESDSMYVALNGNESVGVIDERWKNGEMQNEQAKNDFI